MNLEAIRTQAFKITIGFESGGNYAAYNNYDKGIVSYGAWQFTAASGNLANLMRRYVGSDLDGTILQPLTKPTEALRQDKALKALLIGLGSTGRMRETQDLLATDNFWTPVLDFTVHPRGMTTFTGIAFAFDTAIQHGRNHSIFSEAEKTLGVPFKSKLGDNGIAERDLITEAAKIRKRRLDAQAERDNLPGMKRRGDYWIEQVKESDWS